MRLAIAIALVLVPVLALADSSVPHGAPAAAQLCVQLHTGLSEPSARSVEWQASVRPLAGRAKVSESVLRVRDAAGRVVFTDPRAFFGGDAGPPWDLALGMSSNAGPTLPELPAGDYTAVWTVGGADSATARFSIGAAAPPPLALEWSSCACGPPLVAHLYNPGPRDVDLLQSLEKSVLIVDGKRHERQGIEWDGGTMLTPRRSWNVSLAPGEYGVVLAPGEHSIELEMGGRRARVDHAAADCRATAAAPPQSDLTVELTLTGSRYRITHRYSGREPRRFVTGATDLNCDEPTDSLVVDGAPVRLWSDLPCGGFAFRRARTLSPGEAWTIEGSLPLYEGTHTVSARYCPTRDALKEVDPAVKRDLNPPWWFGCVDSPAVHTRAK